MRLIATLLLIGILCLGLARKTTIPSSAGWTKSDSSNLDFPGLEALELNIRLSDIREWGLFSLFVELYFAQMISEKLMSEVKALEASSLLVIHVPGPGVDDHGALRGRGQLPKEIPDIMCMWTTWVCFPLTGRSSRRPSRRLPKSLTVRASS